MKELYDSMIRFFRKPENGFTIALILFLASFYPRVPLFSNFLLRPLSTFFAGITVNYLWQSKIIEGERRNERLKVIEEFTGLQQLGLKKINLGRDSCEEKGKKYSFNFFDRFNDSPPDKRLIIIGITTGYLPREKSKQIRDILHDHSKLKLEIYFLDPDSPCVCCRSEEMFGDKKTTLNNINDAITNWQKIKEKFPSQITLKKSKAIPYAEYEAVDLDQERGHIYYTPIAYKEHTNYTPSFLFSSQSKLYEFHKKVIKQIIDDAKEV